MVLQHSTKPLSCFRAGHGGVIPTLETHAMLVNGVRYDQLPIVHIHTSSNNTIILITDHTGMLVMSYTYVG